MKIRLNGIEIKLSSGRKKIYDLLNNGNKIITGNVNYLIVNQEGECVKEIKSNAQYWTIKLMIVDKLLIYSNPNTIILNPLIEEIK